MTKRWKKRLIVTGAMLLGGVIGIMLVLWMLMRGTPDWYHPRSMTVEQFEAAAQRATNKLAMVQNEAARARAVENAQRRRPSTSTSKPARDPITVSFTDDELNAFFDKWSVFQGLKNSYEKYLSDPYIVLQDGRVILAGRVKELGAIVSIHFEPSIDEQGRLKLRIGRVLAGKLPLPDAAVTQYHSKASSAIQKKMPGWRQQASIDSNGIPNASAIDAVMSEMLMNVLEERPSEPVLFLPLIDRGSVPVKVQDVKVQDHTLTLTVMPMTSDERGELLRRIRDGSLASGT
jgi:uncharacterized protein YpmS